LWKRLAIILGVVCLSLMPTVVLASNPTVTITVSAWVVGTPSGLVITYISDTEVQLDWTKGAGAENTMVRASYGRAPENRDDGYLVYYGDGITATDTGVNFDEGVADVYYRVWSQSATGTWEEVGVIDFMENPNMILAVFGILALGLFISTFAVPRGRVILAFASAGAWMLLGVYSYTKSVAVWDIYYSLFWLSMGLVFVCVLIPVILREKKDDEPELEFDEYAEYEDDNDPFLGKRKKRKRKALG